MPEASKQCLAPLPGRTSGLSVLWIRDSDREWLVLSVATVKKQFESIHTKLGGYQAAQ